MPAGAKQPVDEGRALEGWAIESAREFAGKSREALAEALNTAAQKDPRPLGLKPHYTYDSVKQMELGTRRAVTTAELRVIAEVTGFPLSWFTSNPKEGLPKSEPPPDLLFPVAA